MKRQPKDSIQSILKKNVHHENQSMIKIQMSDMKRDTSSTV